MIFDLGVAICDLRMVKIDFQLVCSNNLPASADLEVSKNKRIVKIY